MKKLPHLITAIIAASALILASSNLSRALGGDTLNYNGANRSFTYSGLEQRDFFDTFKDLIPGDARSQSITVGATQLQNPATMYLRLDNFTTHTEIYQYIHLTIAKNTETIFDSAADANESLITLHHFTQDESFDLTVSISVPVEVGNEVSDMTRDLQWTFFIEEETPAEPSDNTDGSKEDLVPLPRTYDNSQIYLNICIFTVSLVVLILALSRIFRHASKN